MGQVYKVQYRHNGRIANTTIVANSESDARMKFRNNTAHRDDEVLDVAPRD